MSRRNFLNGYTLLQNEDSTSTFSSPETSVQGLDKITYYLEVDNTVDGEVKFLVCNDKDFNDNGYNLNFEQTLSIDGSVDTEYMFIIENTGFKWLRMDWFPGGGTGDLVRAQVSGVSRGA